MHEPSLRTCANASRRMTTLKSLQRQVLRATIVVTSAATVNYQEHSRIRFCGRRLGVLRSDTRTAGGAYGVPNGSAAPHRSSPPCYLLPAFAGLRRERRSIIAGCGGQRSLRSFALVSNPQRKRAKIRPVCGSWSDNENARDAQLRPEGQPSAPKSEDRGSSRHRSNKRQRPQGALTAFKRMTQR
jgi:hypothetical protein